MLTNPDNQSFVADKPWQSECIYFSYDSQSGAFIEITKFIKWEKIWDTSVYSLGECHRSRCVLLKTYNLRYLSYFCKLRYYLHVNQVHVSSSVTLTLGEKIPLSLHARLQVVVSSFMSNPFRTIFHNLP